MIYRKIVKPFFDFLAALLILIILSPVLLVSMILVKFTTGGPIFFVHQRPGYKEKPVKVIKLCTMNNKRDANGVLLPNMERITKVGAFMRKSSIDELPQLINVVKGDLSLVGPRPLEMRYLPHYSEEQRKRHNVKPGITGYAQVNGRNKVSWEEKFRMDVWYVENISFILDVKILYKTFIKVIRKDDVNSDDNNTVTPFA